MSQGGLLNPTNIHRHGANNRLAGLWPGVVEYNVDPLKQGRCKIRVPSLHSTEKSIETADLPWAVPLHSYGGFNDGGSFVIPIVGATVFVQYIMNDPEHPVYFGSWYKNPDGIREMNTKTSRESGRTLPERPISMGRWDQPEGPEVPVEVLASPYEPTTQILHKSPKGSTVLIEERDSFERLSIIGRGGEEVTLCCPIEDDANKGNAARRSRGAASDGTSTQYDMITGKVATIDIRSGPGGQGIRVISRQDGEFIEITSKDDSSPALSSTGKNRVSVVVGGGLGIFEVVGIWDGEEKVRLHMDTGTGAITLSGGSSIAIQAELLQLVGRYITMNGDVSIQGDLSVRGDANLAGRVTGAGNP